GREWEGDSCLICIPPVRHHGEVLVLHSLHHLSSSLTLHVPRYKSSSDWFSPLVYLWEMLATDPCLLVLDWCQESGRRTTLVRSSEAVRSPSDPEDYVSKIVLGDCCFRKGYGKSGRWWRQPWTTRNLELTPTLEVACHPHPQLKDLLLSLQPLKHYCLLRTMSL
ncbi:hypothetical protein BHE74_00038630, partial [Ensete ventricosum]